MPQVYPVLRRMLDIRGARSLPRFLFCAFLGVFAPLREVIDIRSSPQSILIAPQSAVIAFAAV